MAMTLLKDTRSIIRPVTAAQNYQGYLSQFVRVTCVKAALPQNTTDQIFRVYGGADAIAGSAAIRVRALIGTVTTIIQSTDPVMKVSAKALSTAAAAVGTATDIASTVTLASREVGGMIFVEGDGTAMVLSNAGCAFANAVGMWLCPQGEIYLTTTASKTGAITWDLYYQPLFENAYAAAVTATTAAI